MDPNQTGPEMYKLEWNLALKVNLSGFFPQVFLWFCLSNITSRNIIDYTLNQPSGAFIHSALTLVHRRTAEQHTSQASAK